MTFVRHIIKQVFPRPDSIASGREPVMTGPLHRSDKFMERYRKWLAGHVPSSLCRNLERSFFDVQVRQEPVIPLGFYQERGIEGIYVRPNALMSDDDFLFLMEYLSERIQQMQYRKYHGVSEHREMKGKIRTREEYYLKPAIDRSKYPMPQLYGNITIELSQMHGKVQYLKLAVTTYAGYDYAEADPFHELITRLFNGK